jgi:carbonic anhydrase/acetyltransferase-like protein (isoleucine patch superfamily)
MKRKKTKKRSVLGFIGYGEFAGHLLDIFSDELSQYSCVCVFDDNNQNIIEYPRFDFDAWQEFKHKNDAFLIALGYKHMKRKTALINTMILKNRTLLTLKHKTSIVAKSASISSGCILFAGSCVDSRVHLESGVVVHNGSILSHDVTVGAGTFIAPGVVICGNCKIGKGCFLGAGSIVQNGVQLPDYSMVPMGEKVFRKKYRNPLCE